MRRFAFGVLLTAVACTGGTDEPDGGPIKDVGVRDAGNMVVMDGGGLDSGTLDAEPIDGTVPRDSGTRDAGMDTPTCVFFPTFTDRERYDAILRCLRDTTIADDVKTSVIENFVHTVEASGGFPIATPTGAIFVYVRTPEFDAEDDAEVAENFALVRRQTPISVAGEHNMWVPGQDVMTDEGYDFFHIEIPIDVSMFERSRYRFVAKDDGGGDVWFSDPLSRRFDFDPNGRISIIRGGRTQGHLEWLREVPATMLASTRTIYVYVPPAYDQEPGERFAVLYMHDGNNLFDARQPNSAPTSWQVDEVFERELAANTIRPGIIVGIPNNSNRIGEYTHVPDDIGGGPIGGDSARYAHFVAEELKPLIDTRYRTAPDRANTGVLGSSLGGLVSFHIGLLYPNLFRFVGAMSATLRWGRFGANGPTMAELYAGTAGLAARDQLYYLDSGGGPGVGCMSGGGADNYCEVLEMQTTLETAGINIYPDDPNAVPITPVEADIYHWWEPNAPHSEPSWNARLFRPLRFFFRR